MNLIDVVTRENQITNIAVFNTKTAINALTGALVSETLRYLARVEKGEIFVKPGDVPTIDLVDESEERTNEEGETIDEQMRRELGFEIDDPFKNMCELNNLRVFLYKDLSTFASIGSHKDALYLLTGEPAGDTNWDQPMSAERFLDFRIEATRRPNMAAVAKAIKNDPKTDPEIYQRAAENNALQNYLRLKAKRGAVLQEIYGLQEHPVDTSAFSRLPARLQVIIGMKIIQKQRDRFVNRNLFWASTGNAEAGADAKFMEIEIEKTEMEVNKIIKLMERKGEE